MPFSVSGEYKSICRVATNPARIENQPKPAEINLGIV